MILVVDDDTFFLSAIVRNLESEGITARGQPNAFAALEDVADNEPDIVISDIKMPGMNGLEFRRVYAERYPMRKTPFVFLSGLSDSDDIVRALNEGADDYIIKPVDPQVLVAKAKAMLRRLEAEREAIFTGDLEQLSLVQILQFCEKRGLTGSVEITTDMGVTSFSFDAGELQLDAEGKTEDLLSELMDFEKGIFVIKSRHIGFDEIKSTQFSPPPAPMAASKRIPMGKLSGVTLDHRLFELQTEYEMPPTNKVVTLVSLEGKIITKREQTPEAGASFQEITSMIKVQHTEIEQLVREKTETLVNQRSKRTPLPRDNKDFFIREGLKFYREGDFKAALALLDRAASKWPEDKIIQANRSIVKRKLVQRSV